MSTRDCFDTRHYLLTLVLEFVQAVAGKPGVLSIGLVGSLAGRKPTPKDADLLVRIDPSMDLSNLARHSRRLQGQAQSRGLGADVFLADGGNQYLGRTCPWRRCGRWFRAGCDALSCGQKAYLHDDTATISLDAGLLTTPPVELWPRVIVREGVPDDAERLLVVPLRAWDAGGGQESRRQIRTV